MQPPETNSPPGRKAHAPLWRLFFWRVVLLMVLLTPVVLSAGIETHGSKHCKRSLQGDQSPVYAVSRAREHTTRFPGA